MKILHNLASVALVSLCCVPLANATLITSDRIQQTTPGTVGSGNGALDILLFTQGVNDNADSGSGLNFDDGNGGLGNVAGGDDGHWEESYFTSGKKLKDFFTLNFGGDSGEMMISLDLNEAGVGPGNTNYFSRLDIILNPTFVESGANPQPDPLTTDVQSDEQDAINQIYTGGTLLSSLDLTDFYAGTVLSGLDGEGHNVAKNMPLSSQGAGFADYIVLTGINVYDFADDDLILMNMSLNALSNGQESVFLSGTFSAEDVCGVDGAPICPEIVIPPNEVVDPPIDPPTPVPEPETLGLMLLGLVGLRKFKKV
ncbi:MAG: PEP-CTERM sorting domain-containing protein [Methyloprofundus sp.]|nr:PEP-CTERM sorting domain-containing protein [Methyloprofundus sp.]